MEMLDVSVLVSTAFLLVSIAWTLWALTYSLEEEN
jgi:hypothetical protein